MAIPYGRQTISAEDIAAVIKVLRSDWLTQGPNISAFEEALARYCGAKYAVATSHGTDALHLAYLAAGLKKGDEVITTPNTFAATANMLLAVGAKPVFTDIRLDTYNLDEAKIEKLLTKKTKAIIPVHFAGQPVEMEKVLKLAKKYRLIVIEDACHALGARYRNKKIGSLKSDMAVFSFHPVKAITTAEGGAILTDNEKYYRRLVSLRNHGIYKDQAGKNVMIDLGYNYRTTDLQAALGLSQLKRLDSFLHKRHKVAEWYYQELNQVKEIVLPKQLPRNYSGWHLYVVLVTNPELRDPLMSFLKERGIGVNFHYPAVYSHPYYQKIGYKNLQLPNAEVYHRSCLTLPCFPRLSRGEVKSIAKVIKTFFQVSNGD